MMIKQLPISIRASHKSDVRSQFAALCYRIVRDKPEILLITSRGSGRWIAPKGWPMDGKTPAESAAQEAWEEAGVVGKAHNQCLGLYSYNKTMGQGVGLPCVALVYPVLVKSLVTDFPEKGQRRRKWFSPKKAAARVQEPELARILRDFDLRVLK
jgi:8-oxo-dGTP pyrophosphatase MutT (NUDIX family)